MSAGSALLNAKKILKDVGVHEGSTMADFGAGRSGQFVFPASKMVGNEGVVYAVDVVKEVLDMIDGRRKMFGILNLDPVWGDFERDQGVRIQPSSLDYVFIVNNLWCVQDMSAVISEAKRLLKPTGQVVLIDWRRKTTHPAAPPAEKRLDAMEAEAMFLKNGFRKMRDLSVCESHWGLVLDQPQQ